MEIKAVKAAKDYIRQRNGSNVLTAVSETSLELKSGTLTAISGPSGSGKSTLLCMMAGLLPPSRGKILAGDIDIYSMEDKELSGFRNTHIGFIPQGQTPLMALNVMENVLVPFSLYNKTKGRAYEETAAFGQELMKEAGLWELRGVMPSELSGGELRRMAVCRALCMKPEIVLADEPTGDLDEENTGIVMNLLKSHAENGGTVFVVTHDRQVWEYSDTVLYMKSGIITADKSILFKNNPR